MQESVRRPVESHSQATLEIIVICAYAPKYAPGCKGTFTAQGNFSDREGMRWDMHLDSFDVLSLSCKNEVCTINLLGDPEQIRAMRRDGLLRGPPRGTACDAQGRTCSRAAPRNCVRCAGTDLLRGRPTKQTETNTNKLQNGSTLD